MVSSIDTWSDLASRVEQRWPSWTILKRLVKHAEGLKDVDVIQAQVGHIVQQRLLLEDPDPIGPLVSSLTQLLRDELNRLDQEYQSRHEQGMERLKADANWHQLEPEQKYQLLSEQSLHEAARPKVDVQGTGEILATLDNVSLAMLSDRVAALPARFDNVVVAAAELLEPEAQIIQVPKRMLKTEQDIDTWMDEVKEQLKAALSKGPVVIK